MPEYPVAAAVEEAATLEAGAKENVDPAGVKDALGFLDDVMRWEELDVAEELCAELRGLVSGQDNLNSGGLLSRSFLHRIVAIAVEYRESLAKSRTGPDGSHSISEVAKAVQRGRWAWMAAYALARAARNPESRRRLEHIAAALPGKRFKKAESGRDVIWLLRPAAIWAELLTRKMES